MTRRWMTLGVAVAVAVAVAALVIVVLRADDSPAGWSAPVTLSPAGLVGSTESATSDDGTSVAVWSERSGGQWALMSAERPLGGRWSTPAPIVDSQLWRIRDISMAVNQRGDGVVAFAFWSRSRTVLLASVRPAGGRWGEPQVIAPVISGSYFPKAAIGQDGEAVVAWSTLGPRGAISVARRSSAGWSDPVAVLDTGDVFSTPELVVGPGGEAVLATSINRGSSAKPRLQLAVTRSEAAGALWRDMALPDPSVADSAQPTLAYDAQGRLNLMWARPARGATALVASRADGVDWSEASELDRGPVNGFGTVVAQPDAEGLVVAWVRWAVPSESITIRAARLGANPGAPSPPAVLDTFTLPAGPGLYRGPPSTSLSLAGGQSPTALWSRLLSLAPQSSADVVSASMDRSGTWSSATVVAPHAKNTWPLDAGSAEGTRIAAWATLTNPNGGPIDISVSESR